MRQESLRAELWPSSGLWALPVATPGVLGLGFTARRVGNYQFAPVIENNPIIDQMWVK